MNIIKIYFIKKRPLLESITQTKSLFIILLISIFIWAILFYIVHFLGVAKEAPIHLTAAKPADSSLTMEFTELDFLDFNLENDRFLLEGILSFSFDGKNYEASDFDSFRFKRGQIIHKTPPVLESMAGRSQISFGFTLDLRSQVNYEDFPLDKHRIDLSLTNILNPKNTTISPDHLILRASNIIIERGWQIDQIKASVGQNQAYGGHLGDEFMFSLFLQRDSLKTSIMVLMPLLLILLIGLISLSFDVLKNFNAILSLSVASLTGFFFYRSVIDRLMPPTDQLTIADSVYILMIVLTVLILGIQIYILHYFRKLQTQTHLTQVINRSINNINILRGCLFILFILSLLIATSFMVL